MKAELLTISHASRFLQISESMVRYLHNGGKIPAIRDSAGRRLFRIEDLENFVDERREKKKKVP